MSSKTLTRRFKTQKDQQQFEADWAAGLSARRILAEVLEEKIALVRRQRLEKENYLNPNYAIKQAALNEQERAYAELKALLDIDG